ncbi:MAG: TonB-dependent receptor [Gammaproteobacteria bacterium]|nr:TonB-dependent receptor [Gammaproteobacteria bacterium]
MKLNYLKTRKCNTALAIGAVLVGVGFSVQESHGAVLEEVIVTAQKREQYLQDVGVSVTAFTGSQLEQLGLTNTVNITQQVPNFTMSTFDPSFTIFSLRGISQNNFSDNLEAPVATYVDEAYLVTINAVNSQMFDIERAEILRGPQGTLFGRNATGGLVHFISKKPTEETEGYLRVSAAEFDDYSVEGAVSGAISDKVFGRFSGRWETADGYVKNQNPEGVDFGGRDGISVRGQLQIDMTENLDAWIKVAYSKDDEIPTGGLKFAPSTPDPITGLGSIGAQNDVWKINSDTRGFSDRENLSSTVKLTWGFGETELVSITNYMTNDKVYLEDSDATPVPIFRFRPESEHKQWSQEFRLSGEGENSRWQTGLYYLSFEQENGAYVDGFIAHDPDTFDPGAFAMQSELEATNWSIFGQYEYDFTEELTLVAGGRWSQDDKDFNYAGQYMLDFGGGFETVVAADYAEEINYGDWAARVQLDWRPNDDVLVFASWNRGIKGGNWVTPSFFFDVLNFDTGEIPAGILRHDEETLYSYELGTKISLLGGAARLNATAFYYDYQDYQAFSLTNFVQNVVNRDAEAMGVEVELTLMPAEGWDIMLGLALMDSNVENIPTVTEGVEVDAELPLAPEFSVNGLVRYEWPALNGQLSMQFDFNYNGDQFLETTNASASKEEAHFIGNANITYADDSSSWRVMAWVKNIGNEEYRIYNIDLAGVVVLGGSPFNLSVFAPPRTFGVTASYDF